MEVNPKKEFGFVTHVTFSGHFRCPQERLEGTAETDATAETWPETTENTGFTNEVTENKRVAEKGAI
jgi:hypothetical protein